MRPPSGDHEGVPALGPAAGHHDPLRALSRYVEHGCDAVGAVVEVRARRLGQLERPVVNVFPCVARRSPSGLSLRVSCSLRGRTWFRRASSHHSSTSSDSFAGWSRLGRGTPRSPRPDDRAPRGRHRNRRHGGPTAGVGTNWTMRRGQCNATAFQPPAQMALWPTISKYWRRL